MKDRTSPVSTGVACVTPNGRFAIALCSPTTPPTSNVKTRIVPQFQRGPILLAAVFSLLVPLTGFAQAVPVPSAATNKTAAGEDALQLSAFTVKEDQDIGYESMQTTSGMRTPQELKNLANSISILNAAFIADIGAISV